MKKGLAAVVVSLALTGGALAGCGSTAGNNAEAITASTEHAEGTTLSNSEASLAPATSAESKGVSAADDSVTVIKAATLGTGPKPYIYTNENDEVTGYDVELLRAIFDQLPQYKLEIVQTGDVFGGLDAGYYDLAVNHYGWTKERSEKYVFSDVYSATSHAIIVRNDNTEINGLEDLPGHSTEVNSPSFNSVVFENYNAEHPDNPIDIRYVDDVSMTPLHVSNGSIDFEYTTSTSLHTQVEDQNIPNIRFIELSVDESDAFSHVVTGECYFAPKDSRHQQLIDDINSEFEKLVADGTVKNIAGEFLGEYDIPITQEFIDETNEKIANYS